MGRKLYTEKQLERIRELYSTVHPRDIADELGITEKRVRYLINNVLKISLRKEGKFSREYTSEELEILGNPTLTDYEKHKLLPERTDGSVRRTRRRLKLESKKVVFNRQFTHLGYTLVRSNGTYVRRNRKVMSEIIGRELSNDEHVHHINGDKSDDRPENLYICSKNKHHSLHYQALDIVYYLLEKGIVKFDRENGEYVLCQNL